MSISRFFPSPTTKATLFAGLSAIVLLLGLSVNTAFANTPEASESTLTASSSPNLSVPIKVLALSGQTVTVPISFNSNDNNISGISFSVEYDQSLLSLDLNDRNNDGIPDAISYDNSLGAFNKTVVISPTTRLNFFIFSFAASPPAITSGKLVSVTFSTSSSVSGITEVPIRFASNPAPGFSTTDGQSRPGTAEDGVIELLPCYLLNIGIEPSGSGTVSYLPPPNCGEGKYASGTVVEFTTLANTGYTFKNWSGDISGINPTASLSMIADRIVAANYLTCFSLVTTISPSDGGSVDVLPPYNCGSDTYSDGTMVQFTIHTNSGYVFDRWTGDISGTDINISLLMNANKSIGVNLTADSEPDESSNIFLPLTFKPSSRH